MTKNLKNTGYLTICAVLVFQLSGCGTIMYPERKGQKAGRIDVGVALLDGIGLLLFIIPGVIAFAVDFNNGTIYLPGTARTFRDVKNIKQVKFDPRHSSTAGIEKIIKRETGYEVKLFQNNTKVSKLRSVDDMMSNFAEVLPGLQNTRVTLLTR